MSDPTRPTVLPFPKRRHPKRRPRHSKGPTAEIVPIPRPPAHVPAPLAPSSYLLLALIEAVRAPRGTWKRTGGPDVIGQLQKMHVRWADEVCCQVHRAVALLFARQGGRL